MSMRVTAASDQVTRANPPSVSAGITLVAWTRVRVDRDDFSTFARISVGGSTIVTWATGGTGTDGPNYFTGGGSIANSTGTPVDAWRKIAIACTGTSAKSYVQNPGNSTELDTGTVSSSGTPDLLSLGGRGDVGADEHLNGDLAYFRVFATELTQVQIEAEWVSATAVQTAWADWPLVSDLLDISGNGRHLTAGSTAVTWESDPPISTSTSAPAGLASGTGAVGDPKPSVSPHAEAASGAGSAGDAKPSVSFHAEAVAGTGAASDSKPSVAPHAEAASGTGAASDPTVVTAGRISADAGHASGTGTAHDPTVTVPGATSAAASPAAGTGAAHNTTVTTSGDVDVATGHGAGTGAAHNATVTVTGVVVETGGSWWQLLSILRDPVEQPPQNYCPNDGVPYRTGPNGELYCPFDGYKPGDMT